MEISTSLCEYPEGANCGSGGFLSHTHARARGRAPLHEWSARRRDRYLHNTQQTQETNICVPNGIRIRDPSNRAAADLRLIPKGRWNRWRSLIPSAFGRFLGCLAYSLYGLTYPLSLAGVGALCCYFDVQETALNKAECHNKCVVPDCIITIAVRM
jgi:hypothetical protein